MAYDVESDRVILFGGQANSIGGFELGDTWAFEAKTGTWLEMDPQESPAFGAGVYSMAYDSQSDRLITFIGSYFFGIEEGDRGASETWVYDFNTNTWVNMNPSIAPSDIRGSRLVYDSESDRVILFGGTGVESVRPIDETWAYDYETNTWEEMNPDARPPGMSNHVMAYDEVLDRIVIFGGASRDMWSYDYNVDSWQDLQPEETPTRREHSVMVYDPTTGRMILFGGAEGGSGNPLDDTWTYDPETNKWAELDSEVRPSGRGWHTAVYSSLHQGVVLFGGGPTREDFLNETWIYKPASNEWTKLESNS